MSKDGPQFNGPVHSKYIGSGDGIHVGDNNYGGPARRDDWTDMDDHNEPERSSRPNVNPRSRVFVVHGRDEQVRRAMFGLLRDISLQPYEWDVMVHELGEPSPFNGDVIEHAMRIAHAAVVLLTPDDMATLHPDLRQPGDGTHERAMTGQARANVLIELGMALMAYPERTLICEFGNLRPAADLAGRNVIRFDGGPTTRRSIQRTAQRLRDAGCAVDMDGTDWQSSSRFEGLDAYTRIPPG